MPRSSTKDDDGSVDAAVASVNRTKQERLGGRDIRSTDAILLEDYGMIGGPVTWVASPVILLAIFR